MSDQSFEEIRVENDQLLLNDLKAIASGERLDALISFSKAYLGMFARIEDCDDPELRVHMLANDVLARAILDGMTAALTKNDLPSVQQIGKRVFDEEPYSIGYVVLAGMDRLSRITPNKIPELPDVCIHAAIAFQYANPCSHEHKWSEALYLQQEAMAATALKGFWLGVIEHGTDYLPGYNQVYSHKGMRAIVTNTVLSLLQHWHNCRDRSLRELLQMALRFADKDALRILAEEKLQDEANMSVNRRVYWRSTAFMLEPEKHSTALSEYVERSKERALRLLDFTFNAMQEGEGAVIELTPMAHAQLLRMIAPKFTPREDAHGTLDEIERKVVWMYRQLETDDRPGCVEAKAWLQGVRVMRGTLRYFDALPDSH